MNSYVYAMQCGPFAKIGISYDVEKRLIILQFSNPYDISILRSLEYGITERHTTNPIRHAFLVEREIHRILDLLNMHHRGEWFLAIERPLEVYDKVTSEWTPERIKKRCSEFFSACCLIMDIEKRDKTAIKRIKKDLGEDGDYVLQRFRHAEPRGLKFLSGDNIERVLKIIGG